MTVDVDIVGFRRGTCQR